MSLSGKFRIVTFSDLSLHLRGNVLYVALRAWLTGGREK